MVSRAFSLILCLALAAGGAAAQQQQAVFHCSELPSNWGHDQDNGAWEDMSALPSQAVFGQIYYVFNSRYSSKPLASWTSCEQYTAAAAGCQQTAGEGMNFALQVNFTCPDNTTGGSATVGLTVDINTYQQYINVHDLDVEFVEVDGVIVQGNIDEAEWWESNDNIWGDWYGPNDTDQETDREEPNNASNEYWQKEGEKMEQTGQQVGQEVDSGQITGEQAGEIMEQAGEQIGEQALQTYGRRMK